MGVPDPKKLMWFWKTSFFVKVKVIILIRLFTNLCLTPHTVNLFVNVHQQYCETRRTSKGLSMFKGDVLPHRKLTLSPAPSHLGSYKSKLTSAGG